MNLMKIEQHLRQLHKIQPDQDYVRHSRARLMMLARPQLPRVTLRSFVSGVLRSGSAMAAIGLVLFFAVGGSIWNLVFSPVTGWDSKTLLAEAQAIDTQIHLVDLQYSDPGYERQRLISPNTDFNSISIVIGPEDSILPVSTPADTISVSSTEIIVDPNATSTPAQAEATSTVIGVEEALDILSH